MPIESPLAFYPKLIRENARKFAGYWSVWKLLRRLRAEVKAEASRTTYSDIAIAKMRENEFESLDLYHATRGGEAALARKRRDDAIRAETTHAVPAE